MLSARRRFTLNDGNNDDEEGNNSDEEDNEDEHTSYLSQPSQPLVV